MSALLASITTHAKEQEVDIIEAIELSITYWWSTSYLGDIDDGLRTIDLETFLGLDDDGGEWAYKAEIHHNLWLIPPRIRFTYNAISQKNEGGFPSEFSFDGNDGSPGRLRFRGPTRSDFDMSYYDLLFYYNWIPEFFQVDLGGSVRRMDGYYLMEDPFTPDLIFSDAVFDQTILMLFVGLRVEVPASGWAYEAEIFYSTFDDFAVNEYSLNLVYDFGRIEGELGYQKLRVKADDLSDLQFDISIDGIFFTFRYELF